MDSQKTITQNYNAMDLTKFLMAIVVVVIHSEVMSSAKGTIGYQVYDVIRKMAVPFFFMASSYLLFYRMTEDYSSENNLNKLKKYIFKMLKLYIAWSLVYLPLALYDYIQRGNSWLKSIIAYARGFFIVGEHFYSWQLWYLLSTVYGASVIAFLLKRGWKEWKILILSILVYIMACGINYMIENQNSLKGEIAFLIKVIRKIFLTTRIFNGFCYLSIGMCIAKYKPKFDFKMLLLITIVLFVIMIYFNNFVLLLILNVVFFMLVLSINLKDRKIYYYLREMSIIIYFSHMLVFAMFLWIPIENQFKQWAFPIMLSLILIVSMLLVIFQKKKNDRFYKILFH